MHDRLWVVLVVLSVVLLSVVVAPAAAAQTFTGIVVAVEDGDTIEVTRGPRTLTLRLHGIDAPHLRQPYGPEAKAYLADRILADTVTVRITVVDRFGRIVGVVRQGERNLSEELVEAGLAWWYTEHGSEDEHLRFVEAQARSEERGLWSQPHPTPPWKWTPPSRRNG